MFLASRGWPNARIARELVTTGDMVRLWRRRFAEDGVPGLSDRPRRGRPRQITALERAQICALACQLPARTGVPLARWTGPELRTELLERGLVNAVSVSSVLRILAENPVKPWQYQSWIFMRDPDFAAKAGVVLDLYQGWYQGKPPGPGDRVVSVDAKPSIQVRARCHPSTPAQPGKPARVEHEYNRAGGLALLAGKDIHSGEVTATCPPTTGIAPFMALMDIYMAQDRYNKAQRVFVIVDNGSDHRGKKAIKRLKDKYANCIMIHTPVHASWLNQIEIFFSIIQKKVISPNNFANLAELASTLLAFVQRYSKTAKPFSWEFTSADLTRMLRRIEVETPAPASTLLAA
ncbi:MAG TPA: IS630 family transposase [Actinobacteria bacterium]|nr:IS630 family transposase [Actinomycetota bacterium]